MGTLTASNELLKEMVDPAILIGPQVALVHKSGFGRVLLDSDDIVTETVHCPKQENAHG